jgi:hypothetical protein
MLLNVISRQKTAASKQFTYSNIHPKLRRRKIISQDWNNILQHLKSSKVFGIHKKRMVAALQNRCSSASTMQDYDKIVWIYIVITKIWKVISPKYSGKQGLGTNSKNINGYGKVPQKAETSLSIPAFRGTEAKEVFTFTNSSNTLSTLKNTKPWAHCTAPARQTDPRTYIEYQERAIFKPGTACRYCNAVWKN